MGYKKKKNKDRILDCVNIIIIVKLPYINTYIKYKYAK